MDGLLPKFNLSEAKYISIQDTGAYYTGTEVETALQEVGATLAAAPTTYLKLDQTTPQSVINGAPIFEAIQFDLTPTTVHSEGQVYWDAASKTLAADLEVTGSTLQIGQENHVRCTNKTGSDILDGQVVYIDGAQGQRPTISLAQASSGTTADTTIGIATHDIANNNTGYVTTFGLVNDVDTSSFVAGDVLWLDASTAGSLTATKPTSPNHAVRVGICVYAHATEGKILVSVDTGTHLTDLHDVYAPSPSYRETLIWNNAFLRWQASNFDTEVATTALLKSNNLSDLSDASTARTNLGLVAGGAGDIWVEKAGDTMTGALTINYSGGSPLVVNNTGGGTNFLTLTSNGQLQIPQGTYGLLIGGDANLIRLSADLFYTADAFRCDGGFSMGTSPTTTNINYLVKTSSVSVLSPSLLNTSHTITGGNTGFASAQNTNVTLNSASVASAGIGGVFGFATLSAGNLTGTAYGLFYTARDSRTGTNASTTIGGASVTGQIGSTCNTIYSNAVYGGIFTILDLSAGGAVPTSPHAAASVATLTIGNLNVANAWRYYWALAGSGTTANPVYGFDIGRVNNSSSTNVAIQLDGTNEINNRIRWGTTNAPWIYRSANNTVTLDASSGTAAFVATGTIQGTQLISTIATGTAPLTVTSTTKVTNLNADLLDDQTGSYYLDSANFTGTNWTDLTDGGSTTLHTHPATDTSSYKKVFLMMGA